MDVPNPYSRGRHNISASCVKLQIGRSTGSSSSWTSFFDSCPGNRNLSFRIHSASLGWHSYILVEHSWIKMIQLLLLGPTSDYLKEWIRCLRSLKGGGELGVEKTRKVKFHMVCVALKGGGVWGVFPRRKNERKKIQHTNMKRPLTSPNGPECCSKKRRTKITWGRGIVCWNWSVYEVWTAFKCMKLLWVKLEYVKVEYMRSKYEFEWGSWSSWSRSNLNPSEVGAIPPYEEYV